MSLGYHSGPAAARSFMESLAGRVLAAEGAPSTLLAYFLGPDLAPAGVAIEQRLAWLDLPRQEGWETTVTRKVKGGCVFEAVHLPTGLRVKVEARTELQAWTAGTLRCLAATIEPQEAVHVA